MTPPWAVEFVIPTPTRAIDWAAQFTPARIERWMDFGRGDRSGVQFLEVGFGRQELWVRGPHKLGPSAWMHFYATVRFGPRTPPNYAARQGDFNTAHIRAWTRLWEVSREVIFRPQGNAPRALNKILREMRAELARRQFPR